MNKLPIVLRRLPKCLLNEIYEFAHGDRKHWRTKYELVLAQLVNVIDDAQVTLFCAPKNQNSKSSLILMCRHFGEVERRNEYRHLHKSGYPTICDMAAEYHEHLQGCLDLRLY